MRLAGGSLLASIALKRRQWRLPADRETSPSFLWFPAIQSIEGKERLAGLAPQRCFVAAETIEREVGQISKTQEATCELDSMVDVRLDRFQPCAEHRCWCIGHALGCRTALQRERCSPSSVIGPVLLHALRRLASICLKEVIERQPR